MKRRDLQRDRVNPAYRSALEDSLHRFASWAQRRGRQIARDSPLGPVVINDLLCACIQELYDQGPDDRRSLKRSVHTVLSIKYLHPYYRQVLGPAWDSVKSWQDELPSALRTPWPREVLAAVFVCAMSRAFFTDRKRGMVWAAFGVGCAVQFYTLLRPGEWLKLRRLHVRLPTMSSFRHHIHLALADPKNKRAMGKFQAASNH